MSNPNCRFCDANGNSQTIKGNYVYGGEDYHHFWKCEICDMIYLYPPLSKEDEEKFYNKEFEKFMASRAGVDMDWTGPEKHFQSNQREVNRRMPLLNKFIRKGMKVLELGCSSGFMLDALKKQGLDVYGVDPSGGFIDFVKAKGINVFNSDEELLNNFHDKFDIIIHYYVLEHIAEPVAFVDKYMDMLSDNGLMIFEVPCASDPLVELYKVEAFDQFYWSIAHHWYFSKISLSNVLDKTSFKYELYPEQRYDMSNHMIWMKEGKPGGLGRYSDIFGNELDLIYKNKLKENWLCDTIIAVIKKGKKVG